MAIRIEGGNTVRGNAVGFTADGVTVIIRRRARQQAWTVQVRPDTYGPDWTDPRNQTFPSLREARDYAATLVDEAATLRLAWWPVKVS